MCRKGIDLIIDDIEKELIRERELIFVVQQQLEDLYDQVVIQIRKLRKFYFDLGNDLTCKLNTLKIETHNVTLNKNDIDLGVLNSKQIIEPAYVSNF